jgi:outer membrane protein OmpA-like peptidoglycan-associated protein
MDKLFGSISGSDEEHWISVSDLMAGLMVIFLFIAISYMKDIVVEKERIEQVAITWNETQDALYQKLLNEFEKDLPKWQAEIDRDTLSVRFKEPSILFASGEAALNPAFKSILDDFFPRYLRVLRKFKGEISEVRIEGHTSSEWTGASDHLDAYFKNMKLSQDRTRSVLRYSLSLPYIDTDRKWARETITANGLSSSQPILVKGIEDSQLSRRVEFRVRTNAERRIVNILRGQ